MEPDLLAELCIKRGKFVVRACPGSGKTYAVALRLKSILEGWPFLNRGVAVLSFTNVAWKEIQSKLSMHMNATVELKYPHYLGTIDSFINNFIFLPFGHLVLGCDNRPVLVGEPHGPWRERRYPTDYNGMFDLMSVDIFGNLIPTIHPRYVGFNLTNKNGDDTAHVANLLKMKRFFWSKGYATQLDANYFALQLLEKYPTLARNIAARFPFFILDEAQDTSEIQMRILDKLVTAGLEEVMLVGDPDQAIFEWNNASPALFEEKYTDWSEQSVKVHTNRRSSQLICDATSNLASFDSPSKSIAEGHADFSVQPIVWDYSEQTYEEVIHQFLDLCRANGIQVSHENVAVLCRSKSLVDEIACKGELDNYIDVPPLIYRLLKANHLFQNGFIQEGVKIFEKVFFCLKNGLGIFDSNKFQEFVRTIDRFQYKKDMINILLNAPTVDQEIPDWLKQFNLLLAERSINLVDYANLAKVKVSSLFHKDSKSLDYRLDTIHGAKGETFDATLVILKKVGAPGNSHYRTMLGQGRKTCDEEELRIVYVGITRPRKVLALAVPDDTNKLAWEACLKL